MLQDLTNFFIVFPSSPSIKSTIVSLENVRLRLSSLRENSCKVHKLEYDRVFRKLHIFLRVSDKSEVSSVFTTTDDEMVIEPIENLILSDFLLSISSLIRELNKKANANPSLVIKSLTVRNNQIRVTLMEDEYLAENKEHEIQPIIQETISAKFSTTPLPNLSLEEKLLMIDGNSLLNRVYYASSYKKEKYDIEVDENGEPIGAIKGFLNMMGRYIKQYLPTHFCILWDHPDDTFDKENFRRKLYGNKYKANREDKEESFLKQRLKLISYLTNMDIAQFYDDKGIYEADDLIATLKKEWFESMDGECTIISNDKDLYQLLDERTFQIVRKKQEDVRYTMKELQREFGFTHARQIIDMKAIEGDSSDGYSGIAGIGKKTTLALLNNYPSLEEIYNHLDDIAKGSYARYVSKLEAGKDDGFLCKQLATLVSDVPIHIHLDNIRLKINQQEKMKIFRELGFLHH